MLAFKKYVVVQFKLNCPISANIFAIFFFFSKLSRQVAQELNFINSMQEKKNFYS